VKRKVLAGLVGAMFVCSVGFAAPVVDVAKGDTYLDVSYNKLKADDAIDDDVKLGTTELALTHGLTDKLALTLGYTWTENKLVYEDIDDYGDGELCIETDKAKASISDVKLQYKVSKDFAPFIGYKKWETKNTYRHWHEFPAGTLLEGSYNETDVDSYDQSGAQFGFIYNTKIADKANFFGSAAFGNDIKEYKVGLGYDIAKNTALEVNYKKITFEYGDEDADVKGLGFGLTYKF